MSALDTIHLRNEKINKLRNFKARWDLYSKVCAVLLGFIVPISTVGTHAILMCLMVTWFLAGNFQEKIKTMVEHPVARAAIVLFAVFLFGALYTDASREHIIQQLNKMSKLLYLSFLLPVMHQEKWRRYAILAFLGAMLLTLTLSFLKIYLGLPITNRFTTACIFRDHIYTNLMMAFASFVVGHLILQPQKFVKRLFLIGLLASLVFYVLFLSEGRSGYVIFAVLWLVFCIQRLRLKGLFLGAIILACLFGLVLASSPRFQLRAMSVIDNLEQYQAGDTDSSVGARLEYQQETWKLAKQRPFFGWGTGSFTQLYQTHASSNQLMATQNPHNEYLNILVQTGVVGLIAFLGLFWTIFKNSFQLPLQERWLAQGLLSSMMVGCIANSWLMDSTAGYFFIALIAYCFGALTVKGSR